MIGVVGLGSLGQALASAWAGTEHEVVVYDVDDAAVRRAKAIGATPVDSATALAERADLVVVAVGTDEQVDEVLTGDGGVYEGATDGTTVAVSSTTHPDRCVAWSEALPAGVAFADATIARAPLIPERGAAVYVGATADVYETVESYFADIARAIRHVGPVGMGQLCKLASNHIFWTNHLVNFEALRVAETYGGDVDVIREAIVQGSGDNYALRRGGEIVANWSEKDLSLVLSLADELDVSIPHTECTRDLLAERSTEELRLGDGAEEVE